MTSLDSRREIFHRLALPARLATAWTLLFPMLAHAADRYDGLAYAPRSSALVYRETHWRYLDRGVAARLVLYRCPNGDAFARKQVFDRPNESTPDFELVDARDGYREGVRTLASGREVFWQANRDTAARQRKIEVGGEAVIDAGFDALVRSQWVPLMAGKSVSAKFLLPSSQDFLKVNIRRQPSNAEPGTVRIGMGLDAWYGFVAPDTELVYRLRDRWLLRFEGVGSIRNPKGRHQVVRIEFPDKLRVAGVGQGEVDAAIKAPLKRRCVD
jgi:hypothetical protein